MYSDKLKITQDFMDQAAQHITNKNYKLATSCYKHALFETPDNLKTLNVYVTFLFNLGQYTQALDTLILNMSQFGMTDEKQNLYKNLINEIPSNIKQHLGLKELTAQCDLQLFEASDLASYCAEQDINTYTISPAHTSLLTPSMDCPDSYSLNRLGLHKSPEVKYAIIPSVNSCTTSFTQFINNYAVRDEFTFPDRDHYKLTEYDKRLHYLPSIKTLNTMVMGYKLGFQLEVKGLSLSLINIYDHNYYHWLIELLPNLAACSYINEVITVLIRQGLPKQYYQALELILPSNCKIKLMSHSGLIKQERALEVMGLYTAPKKLHELSLQHTVDSYQSKFSIDWLRRNYFSKLDIDNSNQGNALTFVYLARKGNTGLRVNLADKYIAKSLKPLGFQEVYTEELTFEQQVKLFNSADVIVGSAGAAFANLPFCKPKTKVVILNLGEGNHVNYHGFHKITALLELQLSYFTTQQTKVDNVQTGTKAFSTHTYDSDLLISFLKSKVLT